MCNNFFFDIYRVVLVTRRRLIVRNTNGRNMLVEYRTRCLLRRLPVRYGRIRYNKNEKLVLGRF